MPKPIREVIKAVRPYCKSIRFGNNHYVFRPIKGNRMVIMSASPSCQHYHKNVYKDFLKCGLDIKEILR